MDTAATPRSFACFRRARLGPDLTTRRREDRAGELLHLNDDEGHLGVMRPGPWRHQWIENTCCTLFADPPVGLAAILTAVGLRRVLVLVFAFTLAGE